MTVIPTKTSESVPYFDAEFADDRCDYAATAPCDYDCIFGGDLAELFPETGESPSVLRLNGAGYVVTLAPFSNFPSTTFSISLWVRAISSSGGEDDGTVVSYATPDAEPGECELLLHNLKGLTLLVHGKLIAASERYDGPVGGDLSGIKTGINIARDGDWHHVAVAWRSSDGRVEGYIDGARVFDGGSYKTGAELISGGKLILGQYQSSDCGLTEYVGIGNISTYNSTICDTSSGHAGPRGLKAEIQHFRLWSKFVTADEVSQQMQQPFEGNSVGQVRKGLNLAYVEKYRDMKYVFQVDDEPLTLLLT